jgi:hypothetical protein
MKEVCVSIEGEDWRGRGLGLLVERQPALGIYGPTNSLNGIGQIHRTQIPPKIWLVKWNLALYLSHLSCVERRYMDDYYEYTSRQPKQSFICLSKFNA